LVCEKNTPTHPHTNALTIIKIATDVHPDTVGSSLQGKQI